MRREEYRKRVMWEVGPEVSRYAVEETVRLFEGEGQMGESTVKYCAKLAGWLEASHRRLLALQEDVKPAQAFSQLPSQRLLEAIDPWVWWVRWQIFRCEEPPFVNYEAAVEWLVQTGNEQEATWRRAHTRRPRRADGLEIGVDPHWRKQHPSGPQRIIIEQAPPDPVETRLAEGKRALEGLWRVALTRREIPYKTADEACIPLSQRDGYEYVRCTFPDVFNTMFPPGEPQLWAIPVYPGTSLATLEQMADAMADITGFSKLDAVAYILAGVKPVLKPVDVRVVQKEPKPPLKDMEQARSSVVIELRDPTSLTLEMWLDLYRHLRTQLHLKWRRTLTENDQRLFALVQELGGVPGHGKKGDFWERLRQRWNAEAGAEEYTTGRGLTTRYQRIIQKLNDFQQATKRDTPNSIGLPLPTEEA